MFRGIYCTEVTTTKGMEKRDSLVKPSEEAVIIKRKPRWSLVIAMTATFSTSSDCRALDLHMLTTTLKKQQLCFLWKQTLNSVAVWCFVVDLPLLFLCSQQSHLSVYLHHPCQGILLSSVLAGILMVAVHKSDCWATYRLKKWGGHGGHISGLSLNRSPLS